MLIYLATSWAGAILTAWLLWDHGALAALLAAPFGASALSLVAGILLHAWRRPTDGTDRSAETVRQPWTFART